MRNSRLQCTTHATTWRPAIFALVFVSCPPLAGLTAAFTVNPEIGVAPLNVPFTDVSDGGSSTIRQWLWKFGDATADNVRKPYHTYLEPASYTVGLTVAMAQGSDTWSVSNCILIAEGAVPGPGGPFVEVPNPLSGENPVYKLTAAAAPEPGVSVADSRLGTTQTRVVQTERLRSEYSSHDPFNKDQSMILLMYLPDGEWRVYRTATVPYDQAGNLVRTLDMEEPRWDPSDPNLIWGNREFRILTVNVQTGDITVIKDFSQDATIGPILKDHPDLYRITMKDEGESSTDKRFWAYEIQGSEEDYRARYLFTWDRQPDKVLGVHTLPADQSSIDWVGMSPKGKWVLIGGDYNNGGNLAGLTMANKELTEFHRLNYHTTHSDVGLDSDGNEVIVMQNDRTDYIDLIPIDPSAKPVLEEDDYASSKHVRIVRLFSSSESPVGLNSGVHISCNFPGYCVVSTFIEPELPEQNWLDRGIVLVKLDRSRPRTFYLSKVYGTTGAYWEETQASITSDGKTIVWATNWNQHVGDERVWLVQLNMPDNWAGSLAPSARP